MYNDNDKITHIEYTFYGMYECAINGAMTRLRYTHRREYKNIAQFRNLYLFIPKKKKSFST